MKIPMNNRVHGDNKENLLNVFAIISQPSCYILKISQVLLLV